MTTVLMERAENKIAEPLAETNYTEIELELELDSETYKMLIYCQKKMNVSVDEVIKQCIYTLKDEIL